MSIEAKLIEEYNSKLMSSADVRVLMASVAQDAQTETVDMNASVDSVRNAVAKISDIGATRRQIIGYLNKLNFSKQHLSPEWWWEMNTRLSKLLIVSMILEGDNLRSFGADPELMDIPQCLINIKHELNMQRASFVTLAKRYKEKLASTDIEYLKLYTN